MSAIHLCLVLQRLMIQTNALIDVRRLLQIFHLIPYQVTEYEKQIFKVPNNKEELLSLNIHKYEHERKQQGTLLKECFKLVHLLYQDNAYQLSKLLLKTYWQAQIHKLVIKEELQCMNKQKICLQPSSKIQTHSRLRFQTF